MTAQEACTYVCLPTEEIGKVADFMARTAGLLDEHGEAFGHEYLRDYWEKWDERMGDVIVTT